MSEIIKSPCVGMCTLNAEDMCLGCGRMLDEITSWVSYTEWERDEVTQNCVQRLKKESASKNA